jgi:hypothetical protein|tara:strand:+ start:35777 stop:35947 length:171 start_codon:yes stop_codon:yes gene_type:complete
MEKEEPVPGGGDRMFPTGDEHGCCHGDAIYGQDIFYPTTVWMPSPLLFRPVSPHCW